MANALKKFVTTPTPQTEQADSRQVPNSAGGFTFQVSSQSKLERFLILGTEGGTYYIGEKDLTKQNVTFIRNLISENGVAVLDTVVEISESGRAYRNSPAIFVVALALTEGDDATRAKAKEVAQRVARTGTMIFELADYINSLGGWGRGKRKAIANWFESKDAEALAYQAVKYRQRDGWTFKNLLMLSHATPNSEVATFMLGKDERTSAFGGDMIPILRGFKAAQESQTVSEVLSVLREFKNLPWETIPTQFLADPKVWKALFYNNQLNGQALVRNVTRLSRNGAFADMVFAADYAAKLVDVEMIRKTRLHPIQYLLASVTHRDGQMDRKNSSMWSMPQRNKDWTTVPVIADALDAGFHLSFKEITPANKRTMLAVDVSGSMGQSALGIDLSCAQVSAAVAMTIARTEPWYSVMGFSSQFVDLGITPNMDFGTVLKRVSDRNFGNTDCSLPMEYAIKNNLEVETFIVISDNETYAGRRHPHTALEAYRKHSGINAKLAVLGVASNDFTIARPDDRGMMDFVGFDSNAPRVLADFSADRI